MKTFRDFMESALYAPGRGFYSTRVPKADFYTAPELHPAFGGILAEEVARRFRDLADRKVPGPYLVAEMGSGDGTLAEAVWKTLRDRHLEWACRTSFMLIERCEERMLQSVVSLAHEGARVLGYTRLEDVPEFAGVILSNELVDAFPVHLLEKRGDRMMEVYVEFGDTHAIPPFRDADFNVRELGVLRACPQILGELSTPRLEPYARAVFPHLAEGERHAVNLEAGDWLDTVAGKLRAGAVITVDYGKRYTDETPRVPRTFYRHTVGDDLTACPGRQDLTVSVDFETLIREGERRGLACESYATLSRFLIDRGIMDWMPVDSDASGANVYKERNRIKALIHPDGMGEVFKVLIQRKIA